MGPAQLNNRVSNWDPQSSEQLLFWGLNCNGPIGGQFKFQFGNSMGELMQLQCVAKTITSLRYELEIENGTLI